MNLDAILKKHALKHHTETILAGLLPAIRLVAGKRTRKPAKPGCSRLGGEPDLHWSEPWPSDRGYPLHFLGQIRLSEVASVLPRAGLPKRGWIRLWHNSIVEQMRFERSNIDLDEIVPTNLVLRFDPDESKPLGRRPWPVLHEELPSDFTEHWRPYHEVPVRFERIQTLSSATLTTLMECESRADPRHGWDRCFRAYRAIDGADRHSRGGDHRLLGDVYELQSDHRLTAACEAAGVCEFAKRAAAADKRLRADAARYRLLIRLDSDYLQTGFEWGDAGSAQWWIRSDHLAKGQLGKAVGVYDQGG